MIENINKESVIKNDEIKQPADGQTAEEQKAETTQEVETEETKKENKDPPKAFTTRWVWSIKPWLILSVITIIFTIFNSFVSLGSETHAKVGDIITIALICSVGVINLINQIILTVKLISKKYENPSCGICAKISLCFLIFSVILLVAWTANQAGFALIKIPAQVTLTISLGFMALRGIIRLFKKNSKIQRKTRKQNLM